MANEIKLVFAGDSKSLERAADRAGDAVTDMADDFKRADKEAGKFSGGVTGLNDKIDASEGKFMAAADLADGLASSLGINVGPTIEYARAFGDMAGGFTGLVAPALESMSGKFSKLTFVTKIQTGATTALNAVMRANPIGLIVTALAALAIGFTIAYKKSETFRRIVHGIKDAVLDAGKKLMGLAEIITLPYTIAFRAIARLWNSTIGKLEVNIPGFSIPFGPSFGGISFGVPDIPELATGGVARGGRPHIVGERGPELFIPGQTGTVVPNGGFGGARVDIVLSGDAELVALMRRSIRTRGGNVQTVLGAA